MNTAVPTIIIPYEGPQDNDEVRDIFVYLRPESNGVLVESTLLRVIESPDKYGERVELVYLANIPGEFIVERKIVEDHYRHKIVFAQNGPELFTASMKEKFESHFGVDFDTADILGAFEALTVLGVSEEELFNIRVPFGDVLAVNCQHVKKIENRYIVNYDIPALIHKNSNTTDIAVMVFRSTQTNDEFHRMIEAMTTSLMDSGILGDPKRSGRVFHFSKGPFEQILDARGHLFREGGTPVPLAEMQFCSFLQGKGILCSEVNKILDFPIMDFRTQSGEIIEDCLYNYSQDATYEQAYTILTSAVSQYLMRP